MLQIRGNSVLAYKQEPLRQLCVDGDLARIADWIATEIGATSVQTGENRITLRISDREYTLQIDPDFLSAHPGDDAMTMIRQWNVPAELCRAEGLHFMLTPAGLRLASSN